MIKLLVIIFFTAIIIECITGIFESDGHCSVGACNVCMWHNICPESKNKE